MYRLALFFWSFESVQRTFICEGSLAYVDIFRWSRTYAVCKLACPSLECLYSFVYSLSKFLNVCICEGRSHLLYRPTAPYTSLVVETYSCIRHSHFSLALLEPSMWTKS